MYRLLPFLVMLAVIPDSEKNLENLGSFIQATRDSVASIKNGMNNFHATMMPLMRAMAGEKPGQTDRSGSPGKGEGDARPLEVS